jgi:SCP-2 sterol transfer family
LKREEGDGVAATGRTMKRETTADTVGEFFGGLAKRRREPLLQNVSGTPRFDLVDGKRVEHWYLTVKHGDVAVSHNDAEADATSEPVKHSSPT